MELLDMLRCPVAIKNGQDGTLVLAHDGQWLVCEASGCKYPVVDGIPQMLAEIGKQYVDTAADALPVPPPAAE